MNEVEEIKNRLFKFWESKLENKLGHKVSGINIFKDEIGYCGNYYKKKALHNKYK